MPTLPLALKPTAAYSVSSPSGAFMTEGEGGPDRTGLLFERGPQTFQVTFVLTAEKFQVWTLFYHRIIGLGTIPFTMPLDSGFGVQPHEATIVPNSYGAVRNGQAWTVTFQARATGKAYDFTPEQAQEFLDLYDATGEELSSIINGLYRFANIDSLVLDF